MEFAAWRLAVYFRIGRVPNMTYLAFGDNERGRLPAGLRPNYFEMIIFAGVELESIDDSVWSIDDSLFRKRKLLFL